MTRLVLLLKHQQRGIVGGIVLVNLPILKLQGKWRHIGEHLIAKLHIVTGDVGHHPEGEHLSLVTRNTGPLSLVQDNLRQKMILVSAPVLLEI